MMPMMKIEPTARLFHCTRCHVSVVICRHCDRGNIYCGSSCCETSRRVNHRFANQKYQRSLKGRLNHAKRQRLYCERKKHDIKKVTDQGSLDLSHRDVLDTSPDERLLPKIRTGYCHFCRKPVSLFLRSGFLRHARSSWPLGP